jgi:dihydrofolate synthase/folylpolyglutamate synthase
VLVVDSAHNTDSARKLRSALVEWFPAPPRGRTALVFGASADKDIAGMLEAFLGAENDVLPIEKILITRSVHPRAAATDALLEQVRSYLPSAAVSVHDSPDAALEEVLAWAEPDDLICVTGSIFVVAQVRRAWALRRPETFATDDWVFQDETNVAIVPDDAPELATIGLFDAPV